jgi:hypothetical protein
MARCSCCGRRTSFTSTRSTRMPQGSVAYRCPVVCSSILVQALAIKTRLKIKGKYFELADF